MKSKSPGRNQGNSPEDDNSAQPGRKNDLPIAAVGASAGGIEAFTELISNLHSQLALSYSSSSPARPEQSGHTATSDIPFGLSVGPELQPAIFFPLLS